MILKLIKLYIVEVKKGVEVKKIKAFACVVLKL